MRRPHARSLPPLSLALASLGFACGGPPARAPARGQSAADSAAPAPSQAIAAASPGGEAEVVATQAREASGEAVALRAFGNEAAMRAYVAPVVAERRRERAAERAAERRARADEAGARAVMRAPPMARPASAGRAAPKPAGPAGPAAQAESVTNAQHAGVDEGGIVKVHGEHLVILRRGRLFTVRVGGGDLRPVFATDAFGPGVDPADAWYDEMLIAGDRVVVVGFSAERGGTEIGLFDIDAAGRLAHRSTHHLRSDDYYSSRNYASRLVGDKLVFYAPLSFDADAPDPLASLPSARRWRAGAGRGGFRRISAFSHVYHAPALPPAEATALHTVTVCDLGSPSFDCRATTLLGPEGRSFYVAPDAVYVWVGPFAGAAPGGRAHLYRLPLDGGAPGGVRVFGSPVDQFSFLEGDDGFLNVLVRSEGAGDAMGGGEAAAAGPPALARVPIAAFAGPSSAPPLRYALLPAPGAGALQNRFVGDYVLYGPGGAGAGGGPGAGPAAALFAYRYAAGGAASAFRLGHGVERIEAMGGDAVVVGGDGAALHFTSLALGAAPRVAGHYELAGASQGEARSHGFFYQPESSAGGLLGLPVLGGGRRGASPLDEGLARVLFLRNDALRLRELGALAAGAGFEDDDRCRASCVDWYGNARPIFLRGRLFALLGYELVEGRVEGGRVRELGRVSFSPAARGR